MPALESPSLPARGDYPAWKNREFEPPGPIRTLTGREHFGQCPEYADRSRFT